MLKVEGLHTYYGNIHALKGISLEVKEGEIVSLVGEQRCRKIHAFKHDYRNRKSRKRDGPVSGGGHYKYSAP